MPEKPVPAIPVELFYGCEKGASDSAYNLTTKIIIKVKDKAKVEVKRINLLSDQPINIIVKVVC